MRAVSAGSRLPQAAVALDPEAGVGREHRQGHVVGLPVAVRHLLVLAPHQASACSRNTCTRHALSEARRILSAARQTPHMALSALKLPFLP